MGEAAVNILKASGVFPLNRQVFWDWDFVACQLQPETPTQTDKGLKGSLHFRLEHNRVYILNEVHNRNCFLLVQRKIHLHQNSEVGLSERNGDSALVVTGPLNNEELQMALRKKK
jgi:hypothetical protein